MGSLCVRGDKESEASEEQTTAVQAEAALSGCLFPHDAWTASPAFYIILYHK